MDRIVFSEDQPAHDHRSGFVSVIGRPNVGKSTLMNAYLGQKISIVSPKPQTTRRPVLGILTLERAQIIFVDTPGIHRPLHKLGEIMLQAAIQAISDADVLLWLVDASEPPADQDRRIAGLIAQHGQSIPLILCLHKSDLVPSGDREERARAFQQLARSVETIFVSATHGENRDALLEAIIARLPPGPRYFPEDQITDQTERAVAAELIREQILARTHHEVPHAVEVFVEEFKARSETLTYINATIIVERDTQRRILLGRGGQMIKAISQAARQQIEEMVGTQVYLELWVKVQAQWRQKEALLRHLGYKRPHGRG